MPTGGGSSRTVSTQELAPEQRQLLEGVIPIAQDYLKKDLKLFPKSTIPDFTPLQEQGQQSIVNAAGNIGAAANTGLGTTTGIAGAAANPALAGAAGLINAGQPAQQGLGQIINGYSEAGGARDFLLSGALLDPNTNPVLGAQTEAAMRPIFENLTEGVLPGLRDQFVGSNMFGSSRQGIAEGRAINSALQEAGDVATQIQNNAFNQGLGAMLNASNAATSAATAGVGQGLSAQGQGTSAMAGLVMDALSQIPEFAQMSLMPGMALDAVGGQQRQLEAAQLEEKANRFTTKQMLPFLKAQDVANLAFGMGGGSAVTEGSQGGGFDPFGTAMGIGNLGLMAYGLGLFSDRRLKHSISKVFKIAKTQWYRFKYHGSSKWRLGVMADEVPHAAFRFGAFDIVNYGKV